MLQLSGFYPKPSTLFTLLIQQELQNPKPYKLFAP